jgi:hypothetical protein
LGSIALLLVGDDLDHFLDPPLLLSFRSALDVLTFGFMVSSGESGSEMVPPFRARAACSNSRTFLSTMTELRRIGILGASGLGDELTGSRGLDFLGTSVLDGVGEAMSGFGSFVFGSFAFLAFSEVDESVLVLDGAGETLADFRSLVFCSFVFLGFSEVDG